jgi:hypothetical protein
MYDRESMAGPVPTLFGSEEDTLLVTIKENLPRGRHHGCSLLGVDELRTEEPPRQLLQVSVDRGEVSSTVSSSLPKRVGSDWAPGPPCSAHPIVQDAFR